MCSSLCTYDIKLCGLFFLNQQNLFTSSYTKTVPLADKIERDIQVGAVHKEEHRTNKNTRNQ